MLTYFLPLVADPVRSSSMLFTSVSYFSTILEQAASSDTYSSQVRQICDLRLSSTIQESKSVLKVPSHRVLFFEGSIYQKNQELANTN